jgi:uncharacterized membrane protein YraQ (UPF0718 family)
MEIIFEIFKSSWQILESAALYLLFGFVIAGILRSLVSEDTVAKYLRSGRFKSVFYSSLLGIPFPLCSCGVVPAVAGFKRQGANNGACLSFLTSTPETGIDSIALTYSLLGPILTAMRPVTAFISAMCAGLLENYTGKSYADSSQTIVNPSCVIDGCCDSTGCDPQIDKRGHTFFHKLHAGIKFAFNELMGDLAVWFVIGIFLAGIIHVLVPSSWVNAALGSGVISYLMAIIISGPMYVCATLSTPVTAALVMKGMSPGAALVMLMVGPATNIPTIAMVGGLLGKRALGIYVGSIVAISVAMAYVTDIIYQTFSIPPMAYLGLTGESFLWTQAELIAAIIMSALILRVFWRNYLRLYVDRFLLGRNAALSDRSHKCSCADNCCGAPGQKSTDEKAESSL